MWFGLASYGAKYSWTTKVHETETAASNLHLHVHPLYVMEGSGGSIDFGKGILDDDAEVKAEADQISFYDNLKLGKCRGQLAEFEKGYVRGFAVAAYNINVGKRKRLIDEVLTVFDKGFDVGYKTAMLYYQSSKS